MATASVQFSFVPLTDIKSSEANKNFQDVVTFLNTQVIHADASRVFTAIPSGPATDPTTANQFARKSYVDKNKAIARQILTTTSTGFTADATSDFVLAGLVVDATRLYKVSLHTQETITSAAEWRVHLHEDGTQIHRFDIVDIVGTKTLSASVLWLPTTGTKTLDVRLDEISGTATFTFDASATVPRQFWVEDIGVR